MRNGFPPPAPFPNRLDTNRRRRREWCEKLGNRGIGWKWRCGRRRPIPDHSAHEQAAIQQRAQEPFALSADERLVEGHEQGGSLYGIVKTLFESFGPLCEMEEVLRRLSKPDDL